MAAQYKTGHIVDRWPFPDRVIAAISSFRTRPLAARLGLAPLAVAILLAARLAMFGDLAKDYPYVTLYPAVAVAAIFGGWESGLFATALCAVLVHLLSAFRSEAVEALAQAAFLVDSGIVIGLAELAQRSHAKLVTARLAVQNRALLQLFVEQAPTPMAMFDRNMIYLAASEGWTADYGLGGEAIGRSRHEFFPEAPERWKEVRRRALAGETISADRDPFPRADGSTRWVNWQVRPWRYPDDHIGGLVIYAEDVTARVRSEETLRESEAMLRTLSDNLPESLVYRLGHDADGKPRFLYISAAVEKLNGVTAEQALRDANVLCGQILPEYLPQIMEAEQRSRRDLSDFRIDAPMRRPDGEVRWMRLRARPVRAADGQIVWHGVQTDVTAQKRTEEELREQERRREAIVNSALEGVITIDGAGLIQSANPSAQAMFGYDLDEMIGRHAGMLTPEPDGARHDSQIAAYLAGGDAKMLGKRTRVEGRRKNGEIFAMELAVTDARVNDQLLFIGFMRDLSLIEAERRRADALRDELAHAARLADMGEVVAGLAHEIGQPLAAISNFIAAARRLASKEGAAQMLQAFDKADVQARRAAHILARLRGFIEKRQVARHPQNLREVTEEAIDLTFLRARGRDAAIVTRFSRDNILVDVDRVQIQQVIANLVRNAAEASAGQPDAEIVVAMEESDPGRVTVSIRDNGPGVDARVADQLFNPFVSTKASGMGVGLSLCRSIIESHEGTIGYRPRKPHGSEFYFTLPIHRPELRSQAAAEH